MLSDVAKIKSTVRQYCAAANASDAVALQRTLTKNAIIMPPDNPKLKGDKVIAAWVKQSFFDPFRNKLQVKFDRIEVFGSQAVGYGPFSLEMTPKDGSGAKKGTGKHVDFFNKQKNGSWKYSRLIWNYDKPPA